MNVITGHISNVSVEFNLKQGEQGAWAVKGELSVRPEIVYRRDRAVFPDGTLAGSQGGSSAGEVFNPVKVGLVYLEFLNVAPEDGELGRIVTGGRIEHYGAPEGYAAYGHCYLYAPELSANIKQRHASAGVMPRIIELDVDGLEAGVNKKGEPFFLWDRQAVPQLRVIEITMRMTAVDYSNGWRFV